MKTRLIAFIGVALIFAVPAVAQLKVNKTGQVICGKEKANVTVPTLSSVEKESSVVVGGLNVPQIDSLATAVFLGKEDYNRGAYVTFGKQRRIWIGERSTVDSPEDMMELGFMGGIIGTTRGGKLFGYRGYSQVNSCNFRFYTDVRANSFIVDSDSRIKTDVKSLEDFSSQLSRISPISYSLSKQDIPQEEVSIAASEKLGHETSDKPLQPDSRKRFGFMAQEIKELIPELVIEDADGTLGIDYIGFIPLLVDAVKDLRLQVKAQEEEIIKLQGTGTEKRMKAASVENKSLSISGCVLEQNRPNPFSNSTVISCNVPVSVDSAVIFVYDMQGQQVLRLPIEERSSTSVTIEASSLTPGMYLYSLIADGVEIDTKRMIITD